MSDYTPDVVLVRLAYTAGLIDLNSDESRESQVTKHRAEVDRFVARVKAGAWDEGAQAGATALGRMMRGGEYVEPANPYREEL